MTQIQSSEQAEFQKIKQHFINKVLAKNEKFLIYAFEQNEGQETKYRVMVMADCLEVETTQTNDIKDIQPTIAEYQKMYPNNHTVNHVN